MSKVGNYQIPFDAKGNQLHFPDTHAWEPDPTRPGYNRSVEPVWRDNVPFNDTLTYDGHSRGRSAAYMHWKRSDGTGVVMFLADIGDVIKHLRDGKITGTWRFTKRGQNYGIKLQAQADLAVPVIYYCKGCRAATTVPSCPCGECGSGDFSESIK